MTTSVPMNIASPCISVCLLDNKDMCVGCYRTADEITEWMDCDESTKKAILLKCQERFKSEQTIVLK